MKKIVYMVAALLPILALNSCEDQDELPDVDIKMTISGGTFVDNDIYVVQGTNLQIESIGVINNEYGKTVTIPYVEFFLDSRLIGKNPIEPYNFEIDVTQTSHTGRYELELVAPVFATDKMPGVAYVSYRINVVRSADEIPGTGVQTNTRTAHVADQNSSM